MARPRIALPADLTRRATLSDRLDRIKQAPDSEKWEVIERVQRDSEKFRGFRHHAPKTQSRQDHHLDMFKEWVLFRNNKQVDDFTPAELDDFLFPQSNIPEMFENCRQFLIYVYQVTSPRSKMTGEHIAYRTLVHYRESLVFWVKRKFFLRNLPIPSIAEMYHHMTEAMRAVITYNPGQKRQSKDMKTYLGLAELRMLFDHEMLHNRSIEYSEQHWAIWCLIRTTACRAGSLCKSSKHTRHDPLRWSNLDFTVGDEPGKLTVTIHFGNINIKRPGDPERHAHQHTGDDDLHVTLESPQSSNLIFSVAHRLLTIALRRNLLVGIDSISDLMRYQGQNVMIKEANKDDFIFFRGMPQGRGINMIEPLGVGAVDEYLKSRAHNLGWVFKVMGTNAIRRRALTDLVTRIGVQATRRIAGHSPESFTLERYYLFVSPIFDSAGATLEQDITSTGFTDEHRRKWAPLAMNRIESDRIKETRGAALRAMTDRLVLADPDPPEDAATSAEARRQYRKRLRRYAHRALKEHEDAQTRATMTKEQYNVRSAELDASSFAKHVFSRALELQDSEDAEGVANEDWNGFSDEYDEPQDDAAAEDDLENQDGDSLFVPAEGEMEDEAEGEDEVRDLPYKDLAEVFMDTLMENTLNVSRMWSEQDQTCPECQEDETVSERDKAFQFKSEYHLKNHLNSNKHIPFAKFKRGAEIEAQRNDGQFICPYCDEAGAERTQYLDDLGAIDRRFVFNTFDQLQEHIVESNELTDGPRHDQLKELGGWYDSADFFPRELQTTRLRTIQQAHQNLKNLGIKLVHNKPIVGQQESGFPGVVYGESASSGVPARFANSIITDSTSTAIPAKFANLVHRIDGGPNRTAEIPPAFKNSVVRSAPSGARSGVTQTLARAGTRGKMTPPRLGPGLMSPGLISTAGLNAPRGTAQNEPIEVSDNDPSSSMDEDEDEDAEEEEEEEEEDGAMDLS